MFLKVGRLGRAKLPNLVLLLIVVINLRPNRAILIDISRRGVGRCPAPSACSAGIDPEWQLRYSLEGWV